MAPYWEIYEQELYEKGFGFPIWHADPSQNGSEHGFEVKIGDVGYMSSVACSLSSLETHEYSFLYSPILNSRMGKFHRVFNVCYGDTRFDEYGSLRSELDPAYYPNIFGVPPNHQPFQPPWRHWTTLEGDVPEVLSSHSIGVRKTGVEIGIQPMNSCVNFSF